MFLARALAQDGQLILLDEPFAGVDVSTQEQIAALLRELRAEGRIILVSTHDLAGVPELCDRVVLVKRTVLAAGPTAEAFTPANLALAFGESLRPHALPGQNGEAARLVADGRGGQLVLGPSGAVLGRLVPEARSVPVPEARTTSVSEARTVPVPEARTTSVSEARTVPVAARAPDRPPLNG